MKPSEKPLPAEIANNWMTLEEAMAALSVARGTIYSLCDRGLLRKKLWLRRALISRDTIAMLIARGAAR